MMRVRVARAASAALLLAALATVVAGCGDDAEGGLVVSAAASLSEALPAYADHAGYRNARFSFAGSDELAAQIRQGASPDVYAAANTSLPESLHADGLLERPTEFAGNRLVVAVAAASSTVRSLADLTEPGVRLAIGDADVPIGSYTGEILDRLPAAESEAILDNVRSEEPDVLGIVAKLTQGAVDAGLVYRSDVSAAGERLRAIELPSRLRPDVAYGAGVVVDSEQRDEARRFVAGLVSREGQAVLHNAGFLPPP